MLIEGTPNFDVLYGTTGDDQIYGYGTADYIYASTGIDYIDGGTGPGGRDRLWVFLGEAEYFPVQATGPRAYEITSSTITDSSNSLNTTYTSIEDVYFDARNTGDFGDTVDASQFMSPTGFLYILTGDGGDTIIGSAGRDFIRAGAGHNTIDAGEDRDEVTVVTDNSTDHIVYVTASGSTLQITQNGVVTNSITGAETVSIISANGPGTVTRVDASGLTALTVTLKFDDVDGTNISVGHGGIDVFVNMAGFTSGNDVYTGNGGADIYDYTFAADAMDGDTITDFGHDDVIDLQYNEEGVTPTPTHFVDRFIGDATFSGTLGEYRYQIVGNQTLVQADTDGDAVADLTLTIASGGFALEETEVGSNILRIAGNKLTGTEWGDSLTGTGGDDIIDGRAGSDYMNGLSGNDIYYVDDVADNVHEDMPDGGNDTIISVVSYDLTNRLVETLVLSGTAAINAIGNGFANRLEGNAAANQLAGLAGDDTLVGNAGNDTLNGGSGIDTMAGGGGNDSYYIDNAGDQALENAGEGTDHVYSSVSLYLGANVENLTLTGTATNGGGNAGSNTIFGNAQNNVLNGDIGADTMLGGAGNDIFYVDNAGDQVSEALGEGTDHVYSAMSFSLWTNVENLTLTGLATNGGGNALNNIIIGNAQNNVLNGDVGADTMLGGAGNDSFYVDNAGDQVSEIAGEGTDHVYSSMSFSLWTNVENLTLTGLATNGGGNASDNIIIGNAQNNVLNGDVGADTMLGGAGNDSFYVDNAGDRVSEVLNEGTDHVYSSVSFSLWTNVENLTLTGSAISGGGNSLNNTIIGNAQNNVINGDVGADIMLGGAGNDSFYVDNAGDQASEAAGQGTDQVYSSVSFTLWSDVENLTLTGAAATNATGNAQGNVLVGNGAANVLAGWGGRDTLEGGAGQDTLIGGAGGDMLTGGADADMFDFDNWTHSQYLNAEGWDRITDFQTGVDKIDLSTIDANIVGGSSNDAFTYMGYNVLVGTANGPEFTTSVAGQLAIMGPGFNGAANAYSIVADVDGNGTIDLRIDMSSPVVIQVSDILL